MLDIPPQRGPLIVFPFVAPTEKKHMACASINPIRIQRMHHLYQIGCPHQGYIQWLFEDLGPNSVLIKTVDRDIWSSFLNGIKQGKGFSCPVAIVIGAFIIRIWRKSRRATATTAPIEDGAQQYTFHAAHHLDHNPPALDAISYSDDQSRILGFQYDGPQSLPRIRSTSQGFLDAMGAFTIVTKTARQSLKSSIRLLGIPPGDAANFPPFKSWAFHYLQERPILSDIATIVQTTYAPLPPPPAEHTDAPDQVFWRHFGTKMNMQGKVATDAIVPSILQRAKKCFQRGRSRDGTESYTQSTDSNKTTPSTAGYAYAYTHMHGSFTHAQKK